MKHLYYAIVFPKLLIQVSKVTGCLSIPVFASLVSLPFGISSSAAEIKICAITAWIKNFRQVSNHYIRLEAAKLFYANITRVHHFPETWQLGILGNCQ